MQIIPGKKNRSLAGSFIFSFHTKMKASKFATMSGMVPTNNVIPAPSHRYIGSIASGFGIDVS